MDRIIRVGSFVGHLCGEAPPGGRWQRTVILPFIRVSTVSTATSGASAALWLLSPGSYYRILWLFLDNQQDRNHPPVNFSNAAMHKLWMDLECAARKQCRRSAGGGGYLDMPGGADWNDPVSPSRGPKLGVKCSISSLSRPVNCLWRL